MNRIRKIRITNFKRFGNLDLELSPLDCVVGANNSGKSTLLQSLALFDFVVHRCIGRKNGEGSALTLENRSISTEEFFVLPVAQPIDLWMNRKRRKSGGSILIEIHVEFDNGYSVTTTSGLNFNRLQLTTVSQPDDQDWLYALKDYKISYLPIFSSFLAQEERRTPAIIEDALARGRVNSVMRNLLFDLKKAGKIDRLMQILERVFPEIHGLKVEFEEATDRFIRVTYRDRGQKEDFDLFMSGSGFQQFVYLFGFILLRDPNVILLDEPDVHLHGVLQGALLDELKRLVKDEGKQVLFATHSRDLIEHVDPEHIISLEAGTARRLQVRYEVLDTLHSLGSFDMQEMARLDQFRRLLIVENEKDWHLLRIFGAKLLGGEVWRAMEQRLAIWHAKGNPAKTDLAGLRDQLSEAFRFSGEPLRIFAIGDLDYHPQREELMRTKSKDHVTLYVWEKTEIENYLLCPDAIIRLLDLKEMKLLQVPVRQELQRLVEAQRDEVEIRCTGAIRQYERDKTSKRDESEFQRAAKKFMTEHWVQEQISLADAKEVLGCIKKRCQKDAGGAFSDVRLAEAMTPDEIGEEIRQICENLRNFVGIPKK